MSQRIKLIIKSVVFLAIGIILLVICNFILQPFWITDFNNSYDTTNGFYSEPRNTIETVFIGSSHVRYGISPMDLYENYGICAYDLSTDSQPVLASYYWLEETYRLHPETLDTVVFDVSMMRKDPGTASYHKAIDPMKLSYAKLRAVKAYSGDFESFLQNTFSFTAYHERWKELDDTDFLKYGYEPEIAIRGYQFNASQWISSESDFSAITTPLVVDDREEEGTNIDDTAASYFKKMVDFCDEHSLQLVLIKTPTTWTSANHNAIQDLADSYGLEFMDFNVDPYYSEVKFDFATDMIIPTTGNNLHSNYYGASKLTDYLGRYLTEECGNRDIRGDERYAFMEDELTDYSQYVAFRQSLLNSTDPCDYLETAMDDEDCTIIISVKDDAASALTDEQRLYFKSIGLTELSQLEDNCPYIAVIDHGDVITEKCQKDQGNGSKDPITYTGTLHNGSAYTVVSGGHSTGNKSSIVIENVERSNNKTGLNIVVYDNRFQRYVDSADFDTHDAPERIAPFSDQNYEVLIDERTPVSGLTGMNRTYYLYNRECENEKTARLARLDKNSDDGLITYLKAFFDDENIDIYITSQGNAEKALTDSERISLSELGFSELSQLSALDSYAASVCNGNITENKDSHDTLPLIISSNNYMIESSGREESDDKSMVVIDGTEYTAENDGIFIVIYDNITDMVVDTITFEPITDDADETGEVRG